MAGLLDIVPLSEDVEIRGKRHKIRGVNIKGVADLLGRFPELRGLLSGQDIAAEKIISASGDLANAVIAAGFDMAGDAGAETAAGNLSLDEQIDVIAAVLRITMPKGIGPFVEKLAGLGLLNKAAPGSA